MINNEEQLKKEITLVETLGNMEIANEIIKETEDVKNEDGSQLHPLDAQFQSLGLDEAVPLDKSSDEFRHLEGYFNHSKKYGASANAQIQQIYRITRAEENKRFAESFGPDKLNGKAKDGRKLLWHGSRGGNFGGILSQGLRIAPPEAPANGYAFGKGVYLADRSCKSCAYCDPWTSDNTGLLLLCEAQLGDPPYLRTHHEYNAGENAKKQGLLSAKYLENPGNEPPKWMDAGLVNEEFKGAQLPDHRTPLPHQIGNPNEVCATFCIGGGERTSLIVISILCTLWHKSNSSTFSN
jgi:poly [ADP-ribose] polymerase